MNVELLKKLKDEGVMNSHQSFVVDNLKYLTITGSLSYGVSSDASDLDCVGFCIPDKELVFPHTAGHIQGFGTQIQRFDQFQQHGMIRQGDPTVYDVTIYNIVKYFQLCLENNPNMIDSLYTPERCVTFRTTISDLVRENRDIFLHKGSFHKFKGYAYSQLSKIRSKSNATNPKRQESIQKFGYDVKFAYHLVRLMNEAEQIMVEHTLDIEQSREQLKSIRRGEWTLEELEAYFTKRETQLEEVYQKSTLRHSPDEPAVKTLLLKCLEEHFGNLGSLVSLDQRTPALVAELEAVLRKFK